MFITSQHTTDIAPPLIPIENLYYLLSYAWDKLEQAEATPVSQDECRTLADLFARVLTGGLSRLLRRGLDRGYLVERVDTSTLRGKLDVSATVKRNLLVSARVHCVVDRLSHDVPHNQILKATLRRLARCRELDVALRSRVVGLLRRLDEVSDVRDPKKLFGKVQLHRNNAFYGFLLHVCRLTLDCMLVNQRTGEAKFRDFTRDEVRMRSLFEHFVFNFFHREQQEFTVAREHILWQQVEADDYAFSMLPRMETDVSLMSPDRKLVIDTKYYTSTTQSRYDTQKLHSANLYQLYAYLRNLCAGGDQRERLEGMLLYPRVDRTFDLRYRIQGFPIRVVTLDLRQSSQDVHRQLLGLLA